MMRMEKALAHATSTKRGNARDARMALFAQRWDGNVGSTLARCRADGFEISADSATRYLQNPKFMDLLRDQQASSGGVGVWTRVELQQHLTRVIAGLESEGHHTVVVIEPVVPSDADYDAAQGGRQMRKVERREAYYPKMGDRLKAADLLGKTLGAYSEKLELSGDLKISVVDLLDEDLKHAKCVSNPHTAEVRADHAQVVDRNE